MKIPTKFIVATVALMALSLVLGLTAVWAQGPSGDIVDLHADLSKLDMAQCVGCHGNKAEEQSLDPSIKTPHAIHIPMFNGCTMCHKSVDFSQGSAAALRKQVDPAICAGCHGPNPSSGVQLYGVTAEVTTAPVLPVTGGQAPDYLIYVLAGLGLLLLGAVGAMRLTHERRA